MKASTRSLGMLCLVTLVVGISCKKNREVANYDGDYTLTGKVLDEITGAGIPNATVGVIERGRDATSNLGGKVVQILQCSIMHNSYPANFLPPILLHMVAYPFNFANL